MDLARTIEIIPVSVCDITNPPLIYMNFDVLITLADIYEILALEKSSSGCAALNLFNA